MNRFDIDHLGRIIFHNKGKFIIKDNPGGGDCFFHSIIDSGILQFYDIFDDVKNRKELVKMLRTIAINQIKEDLKSGNIVTLDKNPNVWFNRMMNSSYWADDYMISAIQKAMRFRIILIGDNGKIYCNSPYERKIKIKRNVLEYYNIKRDDDYVYTYNSIEKMTNDGSPFIVIWYHLNVHFEIVKLAESDKSIFVGYRSLRRNVPNLLKKYVNECRLISKPISCKRILNELKRSS